MTAIGLIDDAENLYEDYQENDKPFPIQDSYTSVPMIPADSDNKVLDLSNVTYDSDTSAAIVDSVSDPNNKYGTLGYTVADNGYNVGIANNNDIQTIQLGDTDTALTVTDGVEVQVKTSASEGTYTINNVKFVADNIDLTIQISDTDVTLTNGNVILKEQDAHVKAATDGSDVKITTINSTDGITVEVVDGNIIQVDNLETMHSKLQAAIKPEHIA